MSNPKNIIICCDGTSNKFGKNLTNVVKAYSVFDQENQMLYYDPGVGTIADINILSGIKKSFVKAMGLGFGYGLQHNISEVYKFLMYNYVEGDKVYLFGFSRGAYTVKALAGMIHMCGLLERGNEQLIPYAYELYTARKTDFELLGRFKKRFSSRHCTFHFMGIWDSVSSVGSIGNMRNYPYTSSLKNVSIIRHAIAIDERRAYFLRNNTSGKNADVKEVWFAGVHSDVGGGHPEQDSGQAKVALSWMLKEAQDAGIKIDQQKYDRIALGLNNRDYIAPDALGPLHKNKAFWIAFELIPRSTVVSYKPLKREWYIPLYGRRPIPENALLHKSVEKRMQQSDYNPSNLPKHYSFVE